MIRHALAFRVRPGTEDAVAKLLADYEPPALEIDEHTRLVGTAVFMKGNLVIRVVEVEGDLAKVAPHLAADPAVRVVEQELRQYLAEEPAGSTGPEAQRTFFARRLMTTLLHREAPPSDVN